MARNGILFLFVREEQVTGMRMCGVKVTVVLAEEWVVNVTE